MGPRLSWVGSRAWEGAPHLAVLTLQGWGCHLAPQIPRLCPNPEGAKPLRHPRRGTRGPRTAWFWGGWHCHGQGWGTGADPRQEVVCSGPLEEWPSGLPRGLGVCGKAPPLSSDGLCLWTWGTEAGEGGRQPTALDRILSLGWGMDHRPQRPYLGPPAPLLSSSPRVHPQPQPRRPQDGWPPLRWTRTLERWPLSAGGLRGWGQWAPHRGGGGRRCWRPGGAGRAFTRDPRGPRAPSPQGALWPQGGHGPRPALGWVGTGLLPELVGSTQPGTAGPAWPAPSGPGPRPSPSLRGPSSDVLPNLSGALTPRLCGQGGARMC